MIHASRREGPGDLACGGSTSGEALYRVGPASPDSQPRRLCHMLRVSLRELAATHQRAWLCGTSGRVYLLAATLRKDLSLRS